jgi:methylenetetrahydrofolate reductase (NADPH)
LSADTAFDVPDGAVSVPTISFEFFPPKDPEGEQKLWQTIDELQEFKPDFVSMTYGAGGGTRDRTVRIAAEFIARTGVPVIGHLTCVGSTRDELTEVLAQYKAEGFHGVLALRGDPVGGPTAPWVTTPGGFDYADQLVELAAQMGGF